MTDQNNTEKNNQSEQSGTLISSLPHPLSHPSHIYVIARLLGHDIGRLQNARILEVGCGAGGNLLSMASQMPDAQFFGIDLDKDAIQQGKQIAAQLGLGNVRLDQRDIMQIQGKANRFDYVICHDVYAQLNDTEREKLFSVIDGFLAPAGVAYIAYDIYPGYYLRQGVQDMLHFHTARLEEPEERLTQARLLLDTISRTRGEHDLYGRHVVAELSRLSSLKATQITPDYFMQQRRPIYFSQIVKEAARYNLQYLAEADFQSMMSDALPEDIRLTLSKADVAQAEQYLDFINNRSYRNTLFCRKGIELNRNISTHNVQNFWVAGPCQQMAAARKTGETVFECLDGIQVTVRSNYLSDFMRDLNRVWPASISIQQWIDDELDAPEKDLSTVVPELLSDLLTLYSRGAVLFEAIPVSLVSQVSGKPKVSALVRLQAKYGSSLTSQRQQSLSVKEPVRLIVEKLDGEHSLDQISENLRDLIQQGSLSIQIDSKKLEDSGRIKVYANQFTLQILNDLARYGLLIA